MSSSQSATTTQGQNHNKAVAGAALVTQHAQVIYQQETLDTITKLPDLPNHQRKAKTFAKKWIDDILPLIIDTTASVIDYANSYQSTYSSVLSLLPPIEKYGRMQFEDQEHPAKTEEEKKKRKADLAKAKDDSDYARFQINQLLEHGLVPNLTAKKATSKSIADKINQFYADFSPVYQSFKKDFDKANTELIPDDQTKIAKLTAEKVEDKAEADGYMYGAMSAGVAIPFTCLATALIAETGIGIFVGGIIVAGEIAAIASLLSKYADLMSKVNDLTNEINDLNREVAQLHIIESQISGLASHTLTVVNNSSKVASGWEALESDLKYTIQHLNDASAANYVSSIKNDMDEANKQWAVVLTQAKTLQPSGDQAKTTKKFKTSGEMVKAIQDNAKEAGS